MRELLNQIVESSPSLKQEREGHIEALTQWLIGRVRAGARPVPLQMAFYHMGRMCRGGDAFDDIRQKAERKK